MQQAASAPDWVVAKVRASFGRQSFMRTLGARLETVEAGRVAISFSHRDDLTQQHGYLHAGVATSVVDSACGYAALTMLPKDAEVLSVEFKVNFVAPAAGDRFVAEGAVLRAGRTVVVCRGDVWSLGEGERRLVALMQATMMRVPDEK